MHEPWYVYLFIGLALAGTALNARESNWCWPLWLVSNIGLAFYNISTDSLGQAGLFFVYFLLSVYGYYYWKKTSK